MCLEELVKQLERVVVPRGSKLCVVLASSQEVCVGERLVTFFTEHRPCVVISFAAVHECSSSYFV